LDDKWFSPEGTVIDDPAAVLGAFGVGPDPSLADAMPTIVNHAVQKAAAGVVQDPAGSAVGSRILSGGGASGAIYDAFPDLRPIPRMAVGAAVFNSTNGPGRRVLHTHSPTLRGDPGDSGSRAYAIVALADAYANALFAVADRVDVLGADGARCNLVPVSGSIFAGSFARGGTFKRAHLDPSYTLVAIVIATAYVRARGATVPPLTLCYFERDVADRAAEVRAALQVILAR
jgi:hypothetical protein